MGTKLNPMKQAYLLLTAITKDDNDVKVYIRHDQISTMHTEDGYTQIQYTNRESGMRVRESLQDILRMLESPVITIAGGKVKLELHKH